MTSLLKTFYRCLFLGAASFDNLFYVLPDWAKEKENSLVEGMKRYEKENYASSMKMTRIKKLEHSQSSETKRTTNCLEFKKPKYKQNVNEVLYLKNSTFLSLKIIVYKDWSEERSNTA